MNIDKEDIQDKKRNFLSFLILYILYINVKNPKLTRTWQRRVSANRELVERFEKKIQFALARVWGEEK